MRSIIARVAVLAAAVVTLAGCVTRPVVIGEASSCVDLVPPGWATPTPGASLPTDGTVGAWEKFGDAQTGQLDKANVEKIEALGIIRRCQARDAAALARARKPRLF